MNNFTEKLAEILSPIAAKFSGQRHLSAVRDGFIVAMPLIIVASFFVLINNVVLDPDSGIFKSIADLSQFQEIGNIVFDATLGIISILIAFTVSYNLAESRDRDGVIPGVIGIALLFTLFPSIESVVPIGTDKAVEVTGVFSSVNTSATGLFMAIIAALLGTELYLFLSKSDKLNIKMPNSVPPMVAKSFSSLIPSLITLTVFAVAVFTIDLLFDMSFPDLITTLIQAPLTSVTTSFFGIVLITFIQNLLWGFGIHGANITAPILEPTLLASIQENITASQLGQEIPNIITKPFVDVYTLLGGGGCLIGLVIAIFIVSKRKEYKEVAKIGIIPSSFNIAEPVMFGLPVVMNPVLIIPLVIVPAVNLTIAYLATAIGLVSKTVVMVPWTTPPVISAFLATGGDWRAAVLSVFLIAISVVIYIPFVMALNKVSLK